MIWIWFSVMVVLFGAELNAEIEHQTALDSTTGAPLPMGVRGAEMADTVRHHGQIPRARCAMALGRRRRRTTVGRAGPAPQLKLVFQGREPRRLVLGDQRR